MVGPKGSFTILGSGEEIIDIPFTAFDHYFPFFDTFDRIQEVVVRGTFQDGLPGSVTLSRIRVVQTPKIRLYSSMRSGVGEENESMTKARNWIQKNGGATGIPPWGKFYLSVLGLYEWEGNDSLLPELWILPKWLPFHPGRYWPHSRMVFLPMSYAYGQRITAPVIDLIKSVRKEIYIEAYAEIDWKKSRKFCAATDRYQPLTRLYSAFSALANFYEKVHLKFLLYAHQP